MRTRKREAAAPCRGIGALRRHGVRDVFIRQLLQSGGFARVVESENQNTRLEQM